MSSSTRKVFAGVSARAAWTSAIGVTTLVVAWFSTGTVRTQSGAPGGVSTGLVAWQKANDGVSTNALWQDSSAANNDAAQAASASRPAFVNGSSDNGINFNQT